MKRTESSHDINEESKSGQPMFMPVPESPPILSVFTSDKIHSFIQAAASIYKKYNNLLSEQVSEIEILKRICEVNEQVSMVKDYSDLKQAGERFLKESVAYQNFMSKLRPGDNERMKIIFQSPSVRNADDLTIEDPDIIQLIIENLPRFRYKPELLKRGKGRPPGSPVENRIMREFARDLMHRYRKYFKSNTKAYEFIGDILATAGYKKKDTIDSIKKLLR
jgi:hypothetical protein